MLSQKEMDALKQIARGIAGHFGSSCEVVIHELSERSADNSIVAIENGHVSGRKVGDGPSHVVLEQLGQTDSDPEDHIGYLTRTPDGKILKSTSVYIRDEHGKVAAILGIFVLAYAGHGPHGPFVIPTSALVLVLAGAAVLRLGRRRAGGAGQ